MNVRRRGFTLIEILVTIGIILVLVAIVSVGITYVSKAGRNNAVKVTLNNLRGMIAELEAKTSLASQQPPHMWAGGSVRPAVNFWKDGDPQDTSAPEPDPMVAPGRVSSDSADRLQLDAVRNTQLAMAQLAAIPANRTMLGNFPTGTTLSMPDIPATASHDESLVPIPLDPWGNPIIFVPAGGLQVTIFRGNSGGTNPERTFVVSSTDARPFWASAGPDGAFSDDALDPADNGKDFASDNVYSFEN